jgi:diguanylate cyclase (GGDEF)-like protein
MALATRNQSASAFVLLLDLDRFKDVNDTLGHRFGDLLLEQVGSALADQVGTDGAIARLGGDEFAVVGAGRGRDEALALARRVTDSLRDPLQLEGICVDVQASVGISLFPAHGSDAETLLAKADVAMYLAKKNGTGVAIYDERRDHHSPARLALTGELRTAVSRDELVVWSRSTYRLRCSSTRASRRGCWQPWRAPTCPPSCSSWRSPRAR